MARSAMTDLVMKLNQIAGAGKLEAREYRVKQVLNWRTKAKSAIRHLLKGEKTPTLQEAKEIELAYVKHCAERIEAHRVENARLFTSMRSAIAAMEASDPEFFGPQLEALRAGLFQRGGVVSENGSEG